MHWSIHILFMVWGNTYNSRIKKNMNIQKKIVCLMTFNSYFNELGILNISHINNYLTLFMFRYHNLNNLSEVFFNYFVKNSQIHQHNMRNTQKLHKC